jgi:glycosyltransferase involved in cell wall biosynthesis
VEARLIRLGVDLGVFNPKPGGNESDLQELAGGRPLIVVAANRARTSPFKGWKDAVAAFQSIGNDVRALVVCLGDDGPDENYGGVQVTYEGRIGDPNQMAAWYRVADIVLHPARADNSPLSVIEAQACGTPVIATAVGGIPELLVSEDRQPPQAQQSTGILVSPGSVDEIESALRRLLGDADLVERMGASAAEHAARHFNFDNFLDAHLTWYSEILAG